MKKENYTEILLLNLNSLPSPPPDFPHTAYEYLIRYYKVLSALKIIISVSKFMSLSQRNWT